MEKAEVSRLINSFTAIKGYFDTTKRYMPQIAKLVFFIEEIVPLLNDIHDNINQTSAIIPTAAEKLGKVTSATELAATEVMDIVDNVIGRLNSMTTMVDELSESVLENPSAAEKISGIKQEIDGSQDDLFSIMNALQFQDITTQQINSIASTINMVQGALHELLQGFEDDGNEIQMLKNLVFDPNAEFDFNRSAESQKFVDEYLRKQKSSDEESGQPESADHTAVNADIILGEDGQPDIESIRSQLNEKNTNGKS